MNDMTRSGKFWITTECNVTGAPVTATLWYGHKPQWNGVLNEYYGIAFSDCGRHTVMCDVLATVNLHEINDGSVGWQKRAKSMHNNQCVEWTCYVPRQL